MSSFTAQVRFDLGNWFRNGEQAILNVLLPLAALAGSTQLTIDGNTRAVMLVLFSIGASSFTSIAIATAFDRRAGALKVYGVSPLGRRGFVQSRIASAVLLSVAQTGLLTLIATVSKIDLSFSLALIASALLSVVSWISCALILASNLRAEAVLAIANLVFIAASALSWVAAQSATPFAVLTPMSAAVAAAQGSSQGLIASAVWAITSTIIAIKTLRWD